VDGSEIVAGQSVTSGGYAPEVFQPAEHAIDGVAALTRLARYERMARAERIRALDELKLAGLWPAP
jgi:hypothetical protein